LTFSAGALLMLFIEGMVDYLSFGVFLSSVIHSLVGQSRIVFGYVTNNAFTYLGTVAGVLLPPFSLLAMAWMVRAAKRVPVTFWATVAFLLVHSLIPQKQERFILPALPALICLAMTGWSMVRWRDKRWVRGIWTFMWIINLVLLPVGLFNYSQKARIEPLLQLGRQMNTGGIVAVMTDNPQWLPYYYAQLEHDHFYYVQTLAGFDTLSAMVDDRIEHWGMRPPTHVLLLTHRGPDDTVDPNGMDPRTFRRRIEEVFGPVEEVMHTGPSLGDWLLHKMNPEFNHSKESWIFRIEREWEETSVSSSDSTAQR
jgi:hypothetical protein